MSRCGRDQDNRRGSDLETGDRFSLHLINLLYIVFKYANRHENATILAHKQTLNIDINSLVIKCTHKAANNCL